MALRPEVISAWPPDGWMFFQAATGWHAPDPKANNFTEQVANIIKHRRVNPRFKLSTDPDEVARELEAYTERRLIAKFGSKANRFLMQATDKKKVFHRPVNPVARLAGAVSSGANVLKDWLGNEGKAVVQEQAESRANTCVTGATDAEGKPQPCPANRRGISSSLAAPIASAIRAALGLRSQLKLKTSLDAQLHSCQVCLCDLKLKVHVPFKHIADNTPEEVWNELPPHCWMLKERAALIDEYPIVPL